MAASGEQTKFFALTQEILLNAKRVALRRGEKSIADRDLVVGLKVAVSTGKLQQQVVARAFGVESGDFRWPENVTEDAQDIERDSSADMLSEAFLKSQLNDTQRGPAGIATFVGPPGVGQTLLAEAFASALVSVEH